MAVTTKVLIEAKQAEDTDTTQYTAPGDVTAVIDTFTVRNVTGAAETFSVNLVPSGGSVGSDNLFLSRAIAAGQTYTCPEVIGQVLSAGGFISTLASTASSLTIRASGREIS